MRTPGMPLRCGGTSTMPQGAPEGMPHAALTGPGVDDGGGHAAAFAIVGQAGGVPGAAEEFPVAEDQQLELAVGPRHGWDWAGEEAGGQLDGGQGDAVLRVHGHW